MQRTNVTIIGGGSSSFVPTLLKLIIEAPELNPSRVTLMDVDAERVKTMEVLGRKMAAGAGVDVEVQSSLDQRESLVGADFVITAIAVGGMDAWAADIDIPAKYGIAMVAGDSVGPGGIMRCLRNGPVLASVARDVEEVAPEAWILNYTNPSPTESRVMASACNRPVIGLCSGVADPTSAEWLADRVGVSPEEIAMPPVVAGLNHCTAITHLKLVDGRDALPLARENTDNDVERFVLETYGVLPYVWDHWTEFFPQMQQIEEPYAGTGQGLKLRYGLSTHSMVNEQARVSEWDDLAARWTAPDFGEVTLDELPSEGESEGIDAINIMVTLLNNRQDRYIVNTANRGAIPNLPDDAFVEVWTSLGSYGVHPISAGSLPEPLAAHMRRYTDLQRQLVKAVESGKREDIRLAFMLEPSVQARLSLEQTDEMLDEMIEANSAYLQVD